ncbi:MULTISPECIES: LysM peptidoglycan-binding domain-containing protein [unclassified Janthinobacterium]|uniref:LysM peptidoglycan-binding domain-containing protein n=1 Tax=unclassified Janthinobacterium TaxID=2610881 RepID=UPI001E2E36F2|nr:MULTISPECIES: LysM peptidoglycan-binding domain-containing protein [unclassified Janthinobacterium]
MATTDTALDNLQQAIVNAAGKGPFALDAAFLEAGLADPDVAPPEQFDAIIGQAFQIDAAQFLVSCAAADVGAVSDGVFTVSKASLPFIGGLLHTPATLVFSTQPAAARAPGDDGDDDGDGAAVLVVQVAASPAGWNWDSSFPFMGGWPFSELPLSDALLVFSSADGVYPWGGDGALSVTGGAKQNLGASVALPAFVTPFLELFSDLAAPPGKLRIGGYLDMALYDGKTFELGGLMPSGVLSATLSELDCTFAGYLRVAAPSLTVTIPPPVDAPPPDALLLDDGMQLLLRGGEPADEEAADGDQAATLALTATLSVEGAGAADYTLSLLLQPSNAEGDGNYAVSLEAGSDGPPLSPGAAISLIGGGASYFRATPAVLQEFLTSFGLGGMTISGSIPPKAAPTVDQVTLQLRSVRDLSWQPIPAPTPALSFTITSFFLDWTAYQPLASKASGKSRYEYLFGTTFTLLPAVFRNLDGTPGGEFEVQFNSAQLFQASFPGKATLSDFLSVVSNGLVCLPDSIEAEVSNIALSIDGAAQSFAFSSDYAISLSFLTVGGAPILSISEGQISLSGISATVAADKQEGALALADTGKAGAGTAWAGSISGLLGVGASLQAAVSVAYSSQETPPRWTLSASLAQELDVGEMIKQFFAAGGLYDFPVFLPGNLKISAFAIEAVIPSGKPSADLATSYTVDTTFTWLFLLGQQEIGLQKATLSVRYDGAKPAAQQFSGKADAVWIYTAINLKLGFGYAFQPTDKGPNHTLYVSWEGFTATYTSGNEMLSFTLAGWSLGSLIQALVRTLGDPYFVLPSPWDLLNQVTLDGLSVNVSLKSGEKNRLSATYTLSSPLNLGFIVIRSLVFKRNTDGKVTLALDASVPPLLKGSMGDLLDPNKGQDVEEMPSVPGAGSSYFKVFLLMLGQRVAINGASDFSSTKAVIDALAGVPPTTGKTNPVNPGSGVQGQPYYRPDSNWLIAAHFGVLQTAGVWAVDVQIVFNDPNLYGLRLTLGSPKMGGLAGLVVDILYKKISDDVGLFQIDFTFPDSIRNLNFGAVSVVLPMIGIKIYTNGDFLIDIGFPYNMDFTRSFSFSAIVYGVPVLGSGGVYFGKLSSATATQVPKTELGYFNPVIVFGLGLQLGLGYNFVKGPLKAGFALTVFGIIEGVIATYHPYDRGNAVALASAGASGSVQESSYFKLTGTFGVIGMLYGEVDLKIISASLLVNITVSVQIGYESYRAIPLSVTASVRISLRVKIDLGIFSFTISVGFSATVSAQFRIGSDSRAPWDGGGALRLDSLARGRARTLPMELQAAMLRAGPRRQPRRVLRTGAKPVLQLVTAPQFTVLAPQGATASSAQQGAFVCLFAMDAPDPAAGGAGTGTTSFDLLCTAYFPWLLDALRPAARADGAALDLAAAATASVTLAQLVAGIQVLADPAMQPFGMGDLLQLLADSFTVNISAPGANMDGATLFPLFDGLRLDVPDPQGGAGTQAIDLETYATATEQYRSTVAGVLRQVAARVGKAPARPALLAQDDAGAESMAAFIFVDVFSLIGRALLQSAIDAFDNYSYALQPGDSIAGIVAAFNAAGNAIDADDVSLPNAAYPLNGALPLRVGGLSAVIQTGDTLAAIAARYTDPAGAGGRWQTTAAQLIGANAAPRALRTGVTLVFDFGAGAVSHVTAPGDSFGAIAAALGVPLATLAQQASLYARADLLLPTAILAVPPLAYASAVGDTLAGIASRFAATAAGLGRDNAGVANLFAAAPGRLAIARLDALPLEQLWSGVQASGAVAQAAGQVARFITYGLRLPVAQGLSLSPSFLYSKTQTDYALYQLTGQQFPTPASAAGGYRIGLGRNAMSHGVALDFITFAGAPGTSLPIDLDAAYGLLSGVLAYAQAGSFMPSPALHILPLASLQPRQFPAAGYAAWITADLARLTAVTSGDASAAFATASQATPAPYLWQLPDAMLASIAQRQDTLQALYTEAQYADMLALMPAYRPRIGNTPPNSGSTVFQDVSGYAYATRVDFQITRMPAATVATNDASGTALASAATLAHVYELVGPSAADAQRLQYLLSGMAAVGETLAAGLFLLYSEGGSDQVALTGQADADYLCFLTQTNLSTESHPPASRMLLDAANTALPRGIANSPSQFIKLLWEQSVVRGGGYYLYFEDMVSGAGLPPSVFDATGTATLTLVVPLARQAAGAAGTVPNFVNALLTTQAIDPQQDVLVFESLSKPARTQPLARAATATLAALAATYGMGVGQLARQNAVLPLRAGASVPVAGILHQLNQQDMAAPAQALERLAAYYSAGATPLSAAQIAAYNPGVTVALGATMRIPPLVYRVPATFDAPGNTFAALAAYYGLSVDALALGAADTEGLYADGAVLDVDSLALDAQATLAPGNLSFQLERTNDGVPVLPPDPTPQQRQQYAQATLSALYNTLSAGLGANPYFLPSPYSLPFGPQDHANDSDGGGSGDGEAHRRRYAAAALADYDYRQALGYLGNNSEGRPFALLNAAPANPPAGLPPAADNPYLGVGGHASLALRWQDLFGNTTVTPFEAPPAGYTGALDQAPAALRYTDRLLGLSAWPKVQASYLYGTDAGGAPALLLTLRMDGLAYATPADAAQDLPAYQRLYFQLHQDYTGLGVPGLSGNAVSIALSNSLLATPLRPLDEARSRQVRDFVAACAIYLQALVDGGSATAPAVTLSVPVPLAQLAGANRIALDVALVLTRQAILLDPVLAALPDGASVVSAVLPQADTDGGASSYTTFAKALEASLKTPQWSMRAGAGLTRVGSAGQQTQQLFAVRFSDTPGLGIHFRLGQQASYYAPLPVANSLESRTVSIGAYPANTPHALTLNSVDLNLWLQSCLDAIDKFLSATYAPPAYILDRLNGIADPLQSGQLGLVLKAKQTLADAISATVSPVLSSSAADEATRASAAATMRQQLLTTLGPAFAAGAVVVYGVDQVTGADGIYAAGPPALYGQPAGTGAADGTADGAAGDGNQNYTLFPTRLPLQGAAAPDQSRLSFNFISKNVEGQAYVPLDLRYQITHMEFDQQFVPGIENYAQSQWLLFITGPFEVALGNGTQYIPVLNRALPVPPTVNRQTATASAAPQAGRMRLAADGLQPAQLAQWDYGFSYTYRQAAQDAVHVSVVLNVPPQAARLSAAAGPDLFTALAAFVSNYPLISADLDAFLAPLDGKQDTADSIAKATLATTAFQQLVTQVAASYGEHFGAARLAAAQGEASVAVEFDARLEDHDGDAWYALLNVTVGGAPATYDPQAGTLSNGAVSVPVPVLDIDAQQYRATPATPTPPDALLAYRYAASAAGAPDLSFAAALANTGREVRMPGLNVMVYQNAQASLYVQRNRYLCPPSQTQVSTMPAFLYQTPVVKFSDPILPRLSWQGYDLRQVAPVGGSDVAAYMRGFFNALFTGASGSVRIAMDGSYSYSVMPAVAGFPRTSLPVSLLPAVLAPIDAAQPPAAPMALVAQVQQWYDTQQPTTDGGAAMDFRLNFFTDGAPEQLLLSLEDVRWVVRP